VIERAVCEAIVRALGLDYGSKRVGIAVSVGSSAFPLMVMANDNHLVSNLGRLVKEHRAEVLVVGLPVSMSGKRGPMATTVTQFGEHLMSLLGLPVEFVDERLSSIEVERRLSEAGMNARKRRGLVDDLAAANILQAWLDVRKRRLGKDFD
jgi:putative Holliday junction resolvase